MVMMILDFCKEPKSVPEIMEKKVLVVDCDLRNSGIRHVMGESEKETLRTTDAYEILRRSDLNFDILEFTVPDKNINAIIRTAALKNLFGKLREDYDLIFVDTPPCGIISDASIVAGATDAMIYVIRQDAVMQTAIRSGISSMLETETRFLGCILNGATGGLGGYGNYYKYGGYNKYYRYGHSYKYGYGQSHKSGYGYGGKK